MYPSLVSKNKSKLLEYGLNTGDFSRNRKLSIEHTVGIVLHMAAHRNSDGYAITSQNYFSDLSDFLGRPLTPASHQAISKARSKLDWQAFRHLLEESNQDTSLSSPAHRYRGHVVRAVDGTQLTLPRSEDILELFEPHNTRVGVAHYPAALMVTAMNLFTGQCRAARVANHICSEREQLMSMITLDFSAGDISVLDRGFHSDEVFKCFDDHQQHYLCRMRSAEQRRDALIHAFLLSKKPEQIITKSFIRKETGENTEIQIRFLLGPKDSEGKHVVLATNLLDRERYSRNSLLELYTRRWAVETMYGRVKTLLKLESFHSKTVNGVMQEIFANLLVISLTALVVLGAATKLKLDPDIAVPSFKNAQVVVRRHLLWAICGNRILTKWSAKNIAKKLIDKTAQIVWKKQPGRSYPRLSRQPTKNWSLYKDDRLRQFRKLNRNKARLSCQH